MQEVVLVNEQDEPLGTMEKMEAHEKALLHRAFSVFIFNSKGEMLLQQRALNKYHSPGLWTNACCSHPFPEEPVQQAAVRRLNEELGFTVPLQKAFHFTYRAEFDNGLTEHEFDHVFTGVYNGSFHLNEEEVQAIAFKSNEDIETELQTLPHQYTEWFKIAFPLLKEWMQKNKVVHEAT
jgi:isopentenyl-diphosphate Delta-isomerase